MTWTQSIEAFLSTHRSSTAKRYQAALEDFGQWYRHTYGNMPEPSSGRDTGVRSNSRMLLDLIESKLPR